MRHQTGKTRQVLCENDRTPIFVFCSIHSHNIYQTTTSTKRNLMIQLPPKIKQYHVMWGPTVMVSACLENKKHF